MPAGLSTSSSPLPTETPGDPRRPTGTAPSHCQGRSRLGSPPCNTGVQSGGPGVCEAGLGSRGHVRLLLGRVFVGNGVDFGASGRTPSFAGHRFGSWDGESQSDRTGDWPA